MRDSNGGSLDNPRVHVVTGDAMKWLRDTKSPSFDAIIVDLPDPDTPVLGRLYSTEFYALVSRALAPGGLMAAQSGSPTRPQSRSGERFPPSPQRVTRSRRITCTSPHSATGALRWRAGATRRRNRLCRAMRRRCAFSIRRCSTPRQCSLRTCNHARWSRQRWNTCASSKTCATATTSQPRLLLRAPGADWAGHPTRLPEPHALWQMRMYRGRMPVAIQISHRVRPRKRCATPIAARAAARFRPVPRRPTCAHFSSGSSGPKTT